MSRSPHHTVLLGTLLLAATLVPVHAAPPAAPTKTQLIDFFEQLGINTPTPRFGWVVNDPDRGEKQTAYQIVVADDAKKRLWDSGKVASAEQFGVVYAGPPLAKTSRYLWTVRTWDKDGEVSPWSELQSFVTGFFKPGDWNSRAQWIEHPDAGIDVPILLRKNFQVTKPVKAAYLYVTGLGQFVPHLNGKKVGDHIMDPAWTHYDYSVAYPTFDVSAQLVRGQNTIGIMLGSGWLHSTDNGKMPSFGRMRAIAQLHIEYADGTSTDVVTDPTWKSSPSPWTVTDVHGTETYDARMEQPGWDKSGFNDAKWVAAAVGIPPKGTLTSQSAPPLIEHEAIAGKNISSPSANNYVFDFDKNMNAQFGITVSGKAGDVIQLTLGEHLKGDGSVNPGRSKTMTYTLKGGGPETWRQQFSTMGMRYLQVGGVTTDAAKKELPYIGAVNCYFVYSAFENIGTFKASDERYEQIHSLVLNSLRSNMVSIHTDCPNYEKLGWQEVVWTLLPSYTYQHDVYSIYSKILRDVREGQRNDGMSPTIAPNLFHVREDKSAGKYDDSPAWGSSLIIVPWQLYQAYGDQKTLEDNYEPMKKYLAYLKGKESNGVMTYGLGDWMGPVGHQERNVEGAVYVYNTRIVRDAARVLGRKDEAERYEKEFTRVRDAYNQAYFDSAKGCYNPLTQGNQAMPLTFGIVPEGREKDVAEAFIKDIAAPSQGTADGGKHGPVKPNHITAGDVANTFVWRALGDAGQHDLVQTMIMQPDSPSYMHMILGGFRTLVENWNLGNIRSYNHDMMGGIFEWFYRSPGGISILEPGYARFQLKPGMPAGLTSLTASSAIVRGLVSSSWKIEGDTVTWDVKVPVNSTARICVPTRGTAPAELTIQEGSTPIFTKGAAASSVPGLTYDSIEQSDAGTFVVWNAGSGTYRFTWPAGNPPTSAP
ncbi:MAG: family 78 glycoside hydrolase catalytic domain [Luteolibacter sp.]